jgi:hypothetical protein
MNFALMKHHGWNLTELENMIPFEKDLYVLLLRQWMEEERIRHKEEEMRRAHGR